MHNAIGVGFKYQTTMSKVNELLLGAFKQSKNFLDCQKGKSKG